MPSSRARLPPDLGVPAHFSKYYDNIYPRTLLRDRLTEKKDREEEKACLHQHPLPPPMNPALSRGIVRFPLKFLRNECGDREILR